MLMKSNALNAFRTTSSSDQLCSGMPNLYGRVPSKSRLCVPPRRNFVDFDATLIAPATTTPAETYIHNAISAKFRQAISGQTKLQHPLPSAIIQYLGLYSSWGQDQEFVP